MKSCVLNDIVKKYNLTPSLAENNSQKLALFLANWPRAGLTFVPLSDQIDHIEASYQFQKYLEQLNLDYSALTFSTIEGCTFLLLNLFKFTAKNGLKIDRVILNKKDEEIHYAADQRAPTKKILPLFSPIPIFSGLSA